MSLSPSLCLVLGVLSTAHGDGRAGIAPASPLPPFVNSGSPHGVPPDGDCLVRELGWLFAQAVAPPYRANVGLKSVYDAMQLDSCNLTQKVPRPSVADVWVPPDFSPNVPSQSSLAAGTLPQQPLTPAARAQGRSGDRNSANITVYVDPSSGDDANPGTLVRPVKSIERGLAVVRAVGREVPRTVVLRAGTHVLNAAVVLTPADSGLTITNYPNETAVVSGGTLLSPQWSVLPPSPSPRAPPPLKQTQPPFTIYNDSDAVFAKARAGRDTPGVTFIGTFASADLCLQAVLSSPKATEYGAFTWSPPTAGAFALNCHAVLGNPDWPRHTMAGFISGYRDAPPAPPSPSPPPPGPPIPPTPPVTILVAQLPTTVSDVPGLRINGRRAIRARYPNINDPELHMARNPLDGWITARTAWVPPATEGEGAPTPATEVLVTNEDWPGVEWPMNQSVGVPLSQSGAGGQGGFYLGLGGPCQGDVFPGYGYMCAANGGPRGAGQHRHPIGMGYTTAVLPNLPYRNASSAVVHAWRPAHWFTVQWEVAGAEPATFGPTSSDGNGTGPSGTFHFSRGGFQGGEGFDSAAEWFIENVREELDAPNEFYFDPTTHQLFYVVNSTAEINVSRAEFVATRHPVLFDVQGEDGDPVVGVTLRGLVLRDTVHTYLDPHGLPSGGDWALQYVGAVRGNHTRDLRVERNLFTRLGGLGVALYGRNNRTAIIDNEFEFLGGSAVTLWGRTSAALNFNGSRGELPWSDHPNGPDSRRLDCPLDVTIQGNVANDLGIWQKQSSFVFQAVSARTVIEGNVVYNLPRAAINLNDGHGGGDRISRNFLANTCRESGDHGPINSWDRIPYITPVATGAASIVPAFRAIAGNYIVGTYNSQEAVDNDDGSARYHTSGNVLAFADYGMKSDFGGWQNHHSGNVYPYVCSCFGEGPNDSYTNNTCVTRPGGGCPYWPPYASDCPPPHRPATPGFATANNRVYTQSGNVSVCNMPLAAWVALGHDTGSFAGPWPTMPTLAHWIRTLLAF